MAAGEYPSAYVHQLRADRDRLRAALERVLGDLERSARLARQALNAPPPQGDQP